MAITTIRIDVDQNSYEGLSFECDAKKSASNEESAILEYFNAEYPDATVTVDVVNNGRGTRVDLVETDDDDDFEQTQIVRGELDYLIQQKGESWFVYPEVAAV